MTELEPPYGEIWDLLAHGQVIPFLGSGASLTRRMGEAWDETQLTFLPTARELGRFLASKVRFPPDEPTDDLAKVSQYFRVVVGRARLRRRLHEIFARAYDYGPIHELLASVPAPLLIVTTNYDDLIESAFRAAGRPFDLVVHPTDNIEEWGAAVMYWRAGAAAPEFLHPKNLHIDLNRTTVIYKMHGGVDRQDVERDSYVITEDDYADFLVRMAKQTAIPHIFAEPFRTRHFLFLGYSLSDWNFRVILGKIERDLPRSREDDLPAWAIQLNPSPLEQELWAKRGVSIYNQPVDEFVRRLKEERDG